MAHENFVLADNVPANEFMNLEGSKQSKSKGHAIYVKDIIGKFNPDSIRYAIATNMPENKDTDFYWQDLQAKTIMSLEQYWGILLTERLFCRKIF